MTAHLKSPPKTLLRRSWGWIFILLLASAAQAHGDLHERIKAISQRIERFPQRAELYLRRAELHRQHRDGPKLRSDLRRAHELGAPPLQIALIEARWARDRGDHPLSLRHANRILHRHPNHGPALELRSKGLIALGRGQEALEALETITKDPRRNRPDLNLLHARTSFAVTEDPSRSLAIVERGLRHCRFATSLELQALEIEIGLKPHRSGPGPSRPPPSSIPPPASLVGTPHRPLPLNTADPRRPARAVARPSHPYTAFHPASVWIEELATLELESRRPSAN